MERQVMHDTAALLLPCREFVSDVLGLEPEEADPIAIIVAAQLRLRHHRRMSLAARLPRPSKCPRRQSDEVTRIVVARDILLRRTVTQNTLSTADSRRLAARVVVG
jgi:hypothetical protein